MIFFLQVQPPFQLAVTMFFGLMLTILGYEFEDLIYLYLVVAFPIIVTVCLIDHQMASLAPKCVKVDVVRAKKASGLKPQKSMHKDRFVFRWLRLQNSKPQFAVIEAQEENDFIEALFDEQMNVSPIRRRRARLNAMKGFVEVANAFNIATIQQRNPTNFRRSMKLATLWTNGPLVVNHTEKGESGVFGRFRSSLRRKRV